MQLARQLSLLTRQMATAEFVPDPGTQYGEVFTRRWIVELILDLVGYTADHDLGSRIIVEPSCGTGAFLRPIVARLIAACAVHGKDLRSTEASVRAFDLLAVNADGTRKAVAQQLQHAGLSPDDAEDLASLWISTGDFLLAEHQEMSVDFVVGNPPYIRLEAIPRDLMRVYRDVCPTMRGRSDIYVGFIERGLALLKPHGALGFICADRWMRNHYGATLRELIASRHAVDTVITMHGVDAFEDEVSGYPAITVLRNQPQGSAIVAEATRRFDQRDAETLRTWIRRPTTRAVTGPRYEAARLDGWFAGQAFWPAASPAQLSLLANLEARFPPLEDASTGTRVGIGVATGCDDIYITTDPEVVELERLLPLLLASDTADGTPRWSGHYLVNPWNGDGLVDLAKFPRLATYLRRNEQPLRSRYVARKRPHTWYRTIDRIDHRLLQTPKLVLPDLKAASHPVLDPGRYYPHHNLYFLVSEQWDLPVLGGLLLSDVANLFVGAYCVKMRGGCYRFQAQYVRRIRVPTIDAVDPSSARELAEAFWERDRRRATAVAAQLYGIDESALPSAARAVGSSDRYPAEARIDR